MMVVGGINMVNYSRDCRVLFFFSDNKGKAVMMNYERPQHVDDRTLNVEAEINAKDMIKRKLNGAKELLAIGIARTESQHKDIMDEFRKKTK